MKTIFSGSVLLLILFGVCIYLGYSDYRQQKEIKGLKTSLNNLVLEVVDVNNNVSNLETEHYSLVDDIDDLRRDIYDLQSSSHTHYW